jgi:hypothetical protein
MRDAGSLRLMLTTLPVAAFLLGGGTLARGTQLSPTLQIMERWNTGRGPHVVEFASINGMAESPEGSIWVSETLSGAVATLSPSGVRRGYVTRRGDGPGESIGPSLIASHPAVGSVVYDLGRGSFDVFRPDGIFDRRLFLTSKVLNPKGFAVLPSGEFVLGGGIAENAYGFHLFDRQGMLRRSWHPVPVTEEPRAGWLVGGGPLAVTRAGEILVSQAAPHDVLVYALSGRRLRRIARDERILSPIGDDFISEGGGQRTFRWRFPQSAGVFELADGRILNVVWNREESWSLWQVYEPNGRPVRQVRVRRAYRPWAIAANGDVLASYVHAETDEHIAVRLVLAWDGHVTPLR